MNTHTSSLPPLSPLLPGRVLLTQPIARTTIQDVLPPSQRHLHKYQIFTIVPITRTHYENRTNTAQHQQQQHLHQPAKSMNRGLGITKTLRARMVCSLPIPKAAPHCLQGTATPSPQCIPTRYLCNPHILPAQAHTINKGSILRWLCVHLCDAQRS